MKSGKKRLTYEEALERLQGIAEELKDKELDLDHSLDLLEEGVHLANICMARLEDAAREQSEDDA